jgi:hypothetical protein
MRENGVVTSLNTQAPTFGTTSSHLAQSRPNVSFMTSPVNVTSEKVYTTTASTFIPPPVQTIQTTAPSVVKRQSIINFTSSKNIVNVPATQTVVTQQPLIVKGQVHAPIIRQSQVIQPQVVQQPLIQTQIQTVRPPIQQIVRQGPPMPIQQNVFFGSQRVFLPPQGPQPVVQRVMVNQNPVVIPQGQVQVQTPVVQVERQVVQQQQPQVVQQQVI